MSRAKISLQKHIAGIDRRLFLARTSSLIPLTLIETGIMQVIGEILFGSKALASEVIKPMNLIEINLRDQWDFGHVFVPPGLARSQDMVRGPDGSKACLYFSQGEIIEKANNLFLTPLSIDLAPHADTIAVIESFDLCEGFVHGHEATNKIRSPGRRMSPGGGREPIWTRDSPFDPKDSSGNMYSYSSTPTPACLHNYLQKQIEPGLTNGYTYKGISRNPFHTVYHYGAGLPGSEIDRFYTRDTIYEAFQRTNQVFKSTEEVQAFTRILKYIDQKYLERVIKEKTAGKTHMENIEEGNLLLFNPLLHPVDLRLSAEEIDYWRGGVPPQVAGNPKVHIWEQAAWAHKVIASGRCRSVSMEFDYGDHHGPRERNVLDTLALQTALPLARLIKKLKEDNLYDNTIIVLYTTDGGRGPNGDSYGDTGKNGFVIAGGNINGGYYGDILPTRMPNSSGNTYQYQTPRLDTEGNNAPIDAGVFNRVDSPHRLSGSIAWRTVMKSLKIPDQYLSFPDTQDKKFISRMVRKVS